MTVRLDHLLQYIHSLAPLPESVGDGELLNRFVCQRDQGAFSELVRRHGPMVLAVCRRVLDGAAEAEDTFQAVFLVLARKAAGLRQPEGLAAWLHGVARHLALKCRRAKARRHRHEAASATTALPKDPLEELTARELLTVLDEEIERLPQVYRLPLILCGLEGLTHAQAARRLGWTHGSVKGRLLRGRQRLQERLAQRGLMLPAGLLLLTAAASVPSTLASTTVDAAMGCSAETISTGLLTKAAALIKLRSSVGLLLAMVIVAGAGTLALHAPLAEQSSAEPSTKPAKSPVPLQSAIDTVLKKVTPSVVHIWSDDKEPLPSGSGVVVCKDGLIATCAHSRKVGQVVEVRFPGIPGKKAAKGKVRAKLDHRKDYDLALIQIDGKGEWPAIEIGSSGTLTDRDPLLAVGFPGGNRGLLYVSNIHEATPRHVRLGYQSDPDPSDNGKLLRATVLAASGDSGGGLFDLTGSLVGVFSEFNHASNRRSGFVPIDALVQVWKDLAGDRPAPTRSSAVRPAVEPLAAVTAQGVRAVQPSVVEIRCDDWSGPPLLKGKRVDRYWSGVGAYVGEGFFVTKAAEHVLGRTVTMLLPDNSVEWATVVATDPARDLALLKLKANAESIAPIKWADVNDLPEGTVLAAVMPPAFTPPRGVVCVPAHKIPAIPGILPVKVKDAKGGVEITTIIQLDRVSLYPWLGMPPFPLRQGDVITHIAGIPVADREAFVKLVDKGTSIGRHPRVAGEVVRVTYQRQGKTEEATVHLRPDYPATTQLIYPTSYRYSGFPSAIASDLDARPEHCGAPVVDAQGRVVGLLIARTMNIESLILPASEVKASVEAMRKSATSGSR